MDEDGDGSIELSELRSSIQRLSRRANKPNNIYMYMYMYIYIYIYICIYIYIQASQQAKQRARGGPQADGAGGARFAALAPSQAKHATERRAEGDHLYMHICICVHVYVYVCVCVYIDICNRAERRR